MKSIFTLSAIILLALSACSSEKEAAEPADAETQQPADQAISAPVATEEATTGDERPQAVEESGGEPDAADTEDKPIILAQATSPASDQDWQFSEGEHFHRLVPTQPTLGGADKVEVAEIFWYGCGHCYEFEPLYRPHTGMPWTERRRQSCSVLSIIERPVCVLYNGSTKSVRERRTQV